MNTWKQQAAAAVASGYIPGQSWEGMLDRHLQRCFPQKRQQLQERGELEDYLVANVADALDMEGRLVDQGTDRYTAEQLALEQLLVKPSDEVGV